MSIISFGIISEMTENPLDKLSLERRVQLMDQELNRFAKLQAAPATADQQWEIMERYGVATEEGLDAHQRLIKSNIDNLNKEIYKDKIRQIKTYAALGGAIILDPINAIRHFINRRK